MPPYAVADCMAARSRYALLPANCMSHLSCVGQHSPCCAGMTVPAVCFLFPCCRFGLFFFQYFCRAGTVVQGGRSQAFCRCRMMRYRVSIPAAHPLAAVCAVVYLPAAHSSAAYAIPVFLFQSVSREFRIVCRTYLFHLSRPRISDKT